MRSDDADDVSTGSASDALIPGIPTVVALDDLRAIRLEADMMSAQVEAFPCVRICPKDRLRPRIPCSHDVPPMNCSDGIVRALTDSRLRSS